VSTARNAYLSGAHFDYARNRLHLSWAWREDFAIATNCGIAYAYSDDVGRTWRNSAGAVIAKPGELVRVDSPGVQVWDVGPEWGLDNQDGQAVDGLGRPHVLVWHLREPDATEDNRDASKSRYYHYWRDDDGVWHKHELPPEIGSDRDRVHPKAIGAPNGDVFCLFNCNGQITICAATAARRYEDWHVIHVEPGPWDGTPLTDLYRWRDEGVLSIYMQREPAQDRQPTDIYVLDFQVTAG